MHPDVEDLFLVLALREVVQHLELVDQVGRVLVGLVILLEREVVVKELRAVDLSLLVLLA